MVSCVAHQMGRVNYYYYYYYTYSILEPFGSCSSSMIDLVHFFQSFMRRYGANSKFLCEIGLIVTLKNRDSTGHHARILLAYMMELQNSLRKNWRIKMRGAGPFQREPIVFCIVISVHISICLFSTPMNEPNRQEWSHWMTSWFYISVIIHWKCDKFRAAVY